MKDLGIFLVVYKGPSPLQAVERVKVVAESGDHNVVGRYLPNHHSIISTEALSPSTAQELVTSVECLTAMVEDLNSKVTDRGVTPKNLQEGINEVYTQEIHRILPLLEHYKSKMKAIETLLQS